MTLSDAKSKEKLTCGFKCDMKNLMNFHPTAQTFENFTSMGSFCQKYMRFGIKKNTEDISSMILNSVKFEKH